MVKKTLLTHRYKYIFLEVKYRAEYMFLCELYLMSKYQFIKTMLSFMFNYVTYKSFTLWRRRTLCDTRIFLYFLYMELIYIHTFSYCFIFSLIYTWFLNLPTKLFLLFTCLPTIHSYSTINFSNQYSLYLQYWCYIIMKFV